MIGLLIAEWWRGTLIGRLCAFSFFWPTFLVAALQGEEPYATGIRWRLIMIAIAACLVAAWGCAMMPGWVRRRDVMASPAERQREGSMALPALVAPPHADPQGYSRPFHPH